MFLGLLWNVDVQNNTTIFREVIIANFTRLNHENIVVM